MPVGADPALRFPVSLVATFVVMAVTGRPLNVISLAGIAFDLDMIMDPAIVVLDNTFWLRDKGLDRFKAAYDGARKVWDAILVWA